MPTTPVLIFETTRESVEAVAEAGQDATIHEKFDFLAESVMDACEDAGIQSIVLPPGVTVAFKGLRTTDCVELPDVDEEDYSEDSTASFVGATGSGRAVSPTAVPDGCSGQCQSDADCDLASVFKPGDRVICVDPAFSLKQDKAYAVESIRLHGHVVIRGLCGAYFASRFRPMTAQERKTPGQVAYETFSSTLPECQWDMTHESTRKFWHGIADAAIFQNEEYKL